MPNSRVSIPIGSIKDRIALRMVEAAEADGRLTPGKTIIEPTSGNTGIGLCHCGYSKRLSGVEIVMSEAVSEERRRIIRSYGAKVILTPAADGTDGAIRKARSMVAAAPISISCPTSFAMPRTIWRTTRQRLSKYGSRPAARSTIWCALSEPQVPLWAYRALCAPLTPK